MIRGHVSRSDHEVRVKLLYRQFGTEALAGAWTAADRWLVGASFRPQTLLLGVESDLDTRKLLAQRMRGDLSVVAIPGGLFRDRVREIVDFGLPCETLAEGVDFGVFWTMAAGFGPGFRAELERLVAGAGKGLSLSRWLHEEDILRDDGPEVVLYRNFFDDETCLRLRPGLWDAIAERLASDLRIPFQEVDHVGFDGETYDTGSAFTLTPGR